ncbi:MAG TPA: tRNA (N(6)-L-threonylcarbamoyladenosine(37)-C(2))-methylthiotransferase MtaB [Lachnospiraceae bacterium]|nr:tRNA (N(6)-L-threonylcarbamoyladenosine(37)-C(2))-methylthiotransferase MtaB [Lachnospiraceae bacterium]
MQVAFLTLGCKVNYYESECMIREFLKRGHLVVDFEEEADVYVINTCTVTNIADRKSRQMIHRAKKRSPHSLIVATGCYVDSAGEEITKDPAIDLAIDNKGKSELVKRVEDEWRLRVKSVSPSADDTSAGNSGIKDMHKHRTRAFVAIQDGCNQFCTYCLIPYVRGRGRLRSTDPDDVVRMVEDYVDEGCTEVVLTGIHLSSYGVTENRADGFVIEKGRALAGLICRVGEIDGLKRIRLGSLEPRIISREWLDMLKGCDKLMPHFHLSLQSGCDATLKRMNRHYTTVEYEEKVLMLKSVYERPAITTDVIVGFPGETDDEFDNTLAFLDRQGFADMHVFQYSKRDGTVAASMPDQVSPGIKKQRSDILLGRVKEWSRRYKDSISDIIPSILYEEYIKEGDVRFLTGYDERYVRYRLEEDRAGALKLGPGMIGSEGMIML